jgi:hypothetical protein
MSEACCAVSVSPLLRELLLRCSGFPVLYPVNGTESRLVAVLLDKLADALVEKLYLPMPSEARLRKIADKLTADPADRATAHKWAKRIGTSERSLRRLVLQETGMSFGRWRQQLQVILALRVSGGMPVARFGSVAEVSGRIMRSARGGFRRSCPAQHGAQGRVAQRLARHSVGPDCVHDLDRVVLLAP